MSSNKRRVVITGMGTLNPLANNVNETWQKLLAGESGIDTITDFDMEGIRCNIGGKVKNFNLEKLAEENVEYAMFKVLEKLYDEGKRQFLRKLETNIEWLQNYQLQQDLEAMEKEIGRIIDKLK